MLKSWLRNEPRPTGICVLLSLAALIFSLSGAWTKHLSLDPAWLAVICCGIPIILEAVTALVYQTGYHRRPARLPGTGSFPPDRRIFCCR
jgi:hypothetical protein